MMNNKSHTDDISSLVGCFCWDMKKRLPALGSIYICFRGNNMKTLCHICDGSFILPRCVFVLFSLWPEHTGRSSCTLPTCCFHILNPPQEGFHEGIDFTHTHMSLQTCLQEIRKSSWPSHVSTQTDSSLGFAAVLWLHLSHLNLTNTHAKLTTELPSQRFSVLTTLLWKPRLLWIQAINEFPSDAF